ncbi:MAG: N-acetylglucosamine-6-phosphate deacetylase [Bacteroidetes bacterium]|nr:MAG: N-acetylglucosamine-6-phosphate deacetylase [Bacteroidota bacterium]
MRYAALVFAILIPLVLHSCKGSTHKDAPEFEPPVAESGIEGLLCLDGQAVRIEIAGGEIVAIKPLPAAADQPAFYVAPGLIDIQINGYMGVDFSDQNLSVEGVRKAVKALWKAGVTTILPTVITGDRETTVHCFSVLSQALKDEEIARSVPGFHLEGPYISPLKGFRGAHLEKYIRPPDWDEFMGFQEAAGGKIRLITVAPEAEGAIPFIRNCKQQGILVSLGHHNGNAEEINAACEAGASLATHLGNGCANMINRHNNPLWPQLANDSISVSLIADGFHLNKEEVRTFYKVKGLNKTLLISDALDLAGMEPGTYVRGERSVLLTENVVKFPAENVLAGAASPISACVGNMMAFTGCSLAEAIQMSTTNQARMLGMDHLGEIAEGKRADLVLFSMEDGKMIIQQTIIAGEVVYSRK